MQKRIKVAAAPQLHHGKSDLGVFATMACSEQLESIESKAARYEECMQREVYIRYRMCNNSPARKIIAIRLRASNPRSASIHPIMGCVKPSLHLTFYTFR